MKNFKIYALLGFLFLGSTPITAQNLLDLYFGGNKDSLVKEATKLIQVPEPTFKSTGHHMERNAANGSDIEFESVFKSENRIFTVRDGAQIVASKFNNKSNNTIILLHGVKSNASKYHQTAGLLRKATNAEVYALDLRGHGKSEGKVGDVNYINQYVDDLADIITTLRKEKPKGKIIISGHSMGGGVALRYAMEKKYDQPDGFLLFAPLLGHNSPAFPQVQTTETSEEPLMKIHIERIIGLTLLNEIGNHNQDGLPVLFFNMPEGVPLTKYSYRANKSMTPDDYMAGLKAVNKPMLILIGREDEAFSPEATKAAILEYSKGEIQIIDKASHNDVRHNEQSFTFIKDWFSTL